MRLSLLAAILAVMAVTDANAETLRLYAAGSLKAAMTDVARAFEAATDEAHKVEIHFGPSGLMRQRIEKGEPAHVFASANMKHPQALLDAHKAQGSVRMFARNRLCAIVQQTIEVTTESLLDRLLDDGIRVGTSTPKADPSGDYAFALFAKADALKAGARKRLEDKALKLTGGADTEKAPEGRNQYAWVMTEDRADIFLTYCTNAVLAQKDSRALQIVAIPPELAVGADYGLIILEGAPASAADLVRFILSPPAQAILQSYGFGKGDDAVP